MEVRKIMKVQFSQGQTFGTRWGSKKHKPRSTAEAVAAEVLKQKGFEAVKTKNNGLHIFDRRRVEPILKLFGKRQTLDHAVEILKLA